MPDQTPRGSSSALRWAAVAAIGRRAQMVLLSAQGMEVPAIATVTFTSADRARDVLHNFNSDGFDSQEPHRVPRSLPPSSKCGAMD